ncbi:DNA segregation ATPase FtsK/SpoIIIE, S-DNA-T family [Gracilibacillus orientalis]|uniref:DNA segregation ATPase FtsK/SpoIIIE, S-DNA-T family n=1 Tax=Gracilibacillus orientalis TaxID=334253 RepID=A0A1I4N1W6_9BACI|nr:DNA translocase FtsK [Gracilibacillus orientalis]SFM09233.1 DNA segregation ATPase FtsK/SpoIIIE, S-DNA-T family [Gracilibacillus orientalis]
MWKNIKKRWEHLFEENEPELTSETKPLQKKTIETKMAYKYPKNNTTDKLIKRKSVHKENRSSDQKQHQHQQEEHVEYQSKRQPFKAQEVPSPVHGFRNNSKPVIEAKESSDGQLESKVENEHETATSKNEMMEHEQVVESELPSTTPSSPPVTEEKKQSEIENKPSKTVEISKVMETKKKDKNDRKSSAKPLNVMMTPRDKWKQHKKREKPRQHRHESHHPTSDHVQIQKSVPIHLLNDAKQTEQKYDGWVNEQAETLQTTLRYFNIKAKVVDKTQGPSVTRFEIQPEPGVKVSKIKNLSDDIKLNLAAKDIRMEAPIPGKNTIGIEVPNLNPEPVFLQKMLESNAFQGNSSPLTVALGSDIEGNSVATDLKKMPHGLIAGATGSGKSVCINTILISLLYKANHEEVKFLLIDPKMVELTPYNDIPHLVAPVITDVKAATSSLKWAVQEMEDRYGKFVQEGARDINRYNEKMKQQNRSEEHMPYIVIVIDELADLMMTSPQDVEDAICRIAQKARACGIHLLIATQRPSVDVITGLIKANIPSRIAFSVSSQVDSRTILDTNGAEKLLGKGDMLFVENGSGETKRIQGAFVSDDEIERITNYVKQIASPNYLFEQEQLIQQVSSDEDTDELYHEAVEFILDYNGASASLLQRRFKVGYNRAARLIDMMEDNGIISGQNGSKQREILLSRHDLINKN